MRRVGRVIGCLLGLSLSAFAEAEQKTVFNSGATPEAYTTARQVRYGFSIQNKKGSACESADLWVYAPVKQTSTQWCRSIETSHPAELIVDELGNQILHFKFEDLAPYSIKLVRIKANLQLANKPQPVPVGAHEPFIQSSPKIESSHPDMVKAARRFRGKTVRKKAKMIHGWTIGHITDAGYVRDNRGALFALQQKKGDCTESAQLFAALARASGISARVCGGYVCTANTKLYPQAYHNWSEFLDGSTWLLSDPNQQRFDKEPMNYIAMHIFNESRNQNPMGRFSRFRIKGEGLKAGMLDE